MKTIVEEQGSGVGRIQATHCIDILAMYVVDKRHIEKIAQLYGEPESNVIKNLCLRAKEQFKTFLNENNPDGIAVEQIVTAGIPFQTIALKAQALGSDIIVMGGHGRMRDGQIDKIFFGSKAERNEVSS